jgi:hypothetical protein
MNPLCTVIRAGFVVLLALSTAFCVDLVWRRGRPFQRAMALLLILSGLALVCIRC